MSSGNQHQRNQRSTASLLNQAARPSIDEDTLADAAANPSQDVMSRPKFWQGNLLALWMHNGIMPDPHAEWEDG